MEPMRQCISALFDIASVDRDLRERCRAAKVANAGAQCSRKYQIVELAEGRLSERFYEQLKCLLNEQELWQALPPAAQTVAFRALAFRLASRMGCAHHQMLRSRHQQMPYQLFRLLADQSLAQEFSTWPACMQDQWVRAFVKKYPTMCEPEVLPTLHMLAELLPVGISHIESLHASIRRVLTAKSVQTHRMRLHELSAHWICHQFRSWQRQSTPQAAKGPRTRTSHGGRPGDSGVKAKWRSKAHGERGAGGPWRAWMRARASRRPFGEADIPDLSKQYKTAQSARTPEHLVVERAGRAATIAARSNPGQHAFGGSRNQQLRSRRAMLRHFLALARRGQGAECALAWTARPLACGATVAESLAVSRAAVRHQAAELKKEKELMLAGLHKFQAGVGADRERQLLTTNPTVAQVPLQA